MSRATGVRRANAKYIRREFVGFKDGKRVYRYWYLDPVTRKLVTEERTDARKKAPTASELAVETAARKPVTLSHDEARARVNQQLASALLNPNSESPATTRRHMVATLVSGGTQRVVARDIANRLWSVAADLAPPKELARIAKVARAEESRIRTEIAPLASQLSLDFTPPSMAPAQDLLTELGRLSPNDLLSTKGVDHLAETLPTPLRGPAFAAQHDPTNYFLLPAHARAIVNHFATLPLNPQAVVTPPYYLRPDGARGVQMRLGRADVILFDDGVWCVVPRDTPGDEPFAALGGPLYRAAVTSAIMLFKLDKLAADAQATWGSERQRAALLTAQLAAARLRRAMGTNDNARYQAFMEAERSDAGVTSDEPSPVGGVAIAEAYRASLEEACVRMPETDAEKDGLASAMAFFPDVAEPISGAEIAAEVNRRTRKLSDRETYRKEVREIAAVKLQDNASSANVARLVDELLLSIRGNKVLTAGGEGGLQGEVMRTGSADIARFIARVGTLAATLYASRHGKTKFNEAAAKRVLASVMPAAPDDEAEKSIILEVMRSQHASLRKMHAFAEARAVCSMSEVVEARQQMQAYFAQAVESGKMRKMSDFRTWRSRLASEFQNPGEGRFTGLPAVAQMLNAGISAYEVTAQAGDMRAAFFYEMEQAFRAAATKKKNPRKKPTPPPTPPTPPPPPPPPPLAPVADQIMAQLLAAEPDLGEEVAALKRSLVGGLGRRPKAEVKTEVKTLLAGVAGESADTRRRMFKLSPEAKARNARVWAGLKTQGFRDIAHLGYSGTPQPGALPDASADILHEATQRLNALVGRKEFTHFDMLKIAGIPDNCTAIRAYLSGVRLTIMADMPGGGTTQREVSFMPSGAVKVYNALFVAPDSTAEQPAEEPPGFGWRMLVTQAAMGERLQQLGLDHSIKTTAAAGSMNGAYTWAQLGYEATSGLLIDLEGADDLGYFELRDLMSDPLTAAMWRANDQGFSGVFDTNPGSYSMKRLELYARFRAERLGQIGKSIAGLADIIKAAAVLTDAQEIALLDDFFVYLLDQLGEAELMDGEGEEDDDD